VLHDFEPPVIFDPEPVESVVVTTFMDNVTGFFMPDQGVAHTRGHPKGRQAARATILDGWGLDALVAEQGSRCS